MKFFANENVYEGPITLPEIRALYQALGMTPKKSVRHVFYYQKNFGNGKGPNEPLWRGLEAKGLAEESLAEPGMFKVTKAGMEMIEHYALVKIKTHWYKKRKVKECSDGTI